MFCGLAHDHRQERLVTFRGESALDALIKQASREILNGTQDLVAFPFATGGHFGLVAAPRPRVTQGAPLGKTGLIFKEDQTLVTLGGAENRGPCLTAPGLSTCFIEMVRDKTRLLKRKPQIVEQRTHIMAIVEHAELTPDQDAEQDRVPTRCLKADHQWTGLNECDQAFFLVWGQLRSTPTAMLVDEAVHAAEHKGLTPLVETGGAEAPSLTEHLHGYLVYQQVEQHRGAPYQPHIIALIGVL